MLPATAADGAATFFQSIDEVSSGTLPRGINSHGESSQQGKGKCEKKDWPMKRDRGFKWNVVARDFRNH